MSYGERFKQLVLIAETSSATDTKFVCLNNIVLLPYQDATHMGYKIKDAHEITARIARRQTEQKNDILSAQILNK